MKNISETHPSLFKISKKHMYCPMLYLIARLGLDPNEKEFVEIIQRHTIDKAVLRDLLDFLSGEDAPDYFDGAPSVVDYIKEALGLEGDK